MSMDLTLRSSLTPRKLVSSKLYACLAMKNIGKPCAGKPHARFDEGGLVSATSSLLYLCYGLLFIGKAR